MNSKGLKRLPLVGIEEHDREHQEMLETINAMRQTLRSRGAEATKRRVIRAGLESVVTHLKDHFVVEETLMIESDYPGYGRHKREHELFLEKIEALHGRIQCVSMMPSIESLNTLCNWLHHHILESDKPLLPHLVNTALLNHSSHGGEKQNTAPAPPPKMEPRPRLLRESKVRKRRASES
jgi:hemerythrin